MQKNAFSLQVEGLRKPNKKYPLREDGSKGSGVGTRGSCVSGNDWGWVTTLFCPAGAGMQEGQGTQDQFSAKTETSRIMQDPNNERDQNQRTKEGVGGWVVEMTPLQDWVLLHGAHLHSIGPAGKLPVGTAGAIRKSLRRVWRNKNLALFNKKIYIWLSRFAVHLELSKHC